MKPSSCDLSIVIPAFNEMLSLPLLLARLENILEPLKLSYEYVVVDDGSTDHTFVTLEKLSKDIPRLRAISLSRQFGKEAALLAGLEMASGNAVVTIDADLQHPPELITEFVQQWQAGHLMVFGIKRLREDNLMRRGAASVFNRLFSRMAGFDLSRSSDFMLLDRQLVDVLIRDFPERGRFFRGLSRWLGYQPAYVEFDVDSREQGQTNWSPFGLFKYAMGSITRFSHVPLQIITFLGALTLMVSIVLGVEALYSKWLGNAVSGFATLEITLLFVGSVIMIGLGIVGQYLSHIYDEVKRRPIYLVSKRLD